MAPLEREAAREYEALAWPGCTELLMPAQIERIYRDALFAADRISGELKPNVISCCGDT